MRAYKDITGLRFGRLIAIRFIERSIHNKPLWLFRCDCGKEKIINRDSVTRNLTTSCGCYQKEIATLKNQSRRKVPSHLEHEYNTWCRVKDRILNPEGLNYLEYGGRGITMYLEWAESFDSFIRDVGPRPLPKSLYSLDRIDVNGNYEPGNVRWSTKKEQNANQRKRISQYELRSILYQWKICFSIKDHDHSKCEGLWNNVR